MASCHTCQRADRTEIDTALVQGMPLRTIEARYGVSRPSLSRHKKHIGKALARAEGMNALSVHRQVEELRAEARRLQAEAERAGNLGAAIRCIRELRELVELGARLAMARRAMGEIDQEEAAVELADLLGIRPEDLPAASEAAVVVDVDAVVPPTNGGGAP